MTRQCRQLVTRGHQIDEIEIQKLPVRLEADDQNFHTTCNPRTVKTVKLRKASTQCVTKVQERRENETVIRKQQLLHSSKEIGSTETSMSLLVKVGYRRRVQRINERNKFIRKSIHKIERSFVEELFE